jgi:hypothetical protein
MDHLCLIVFFDHKVGFGHRFVGVTDVNPQVAENVFNLSVFRQIRGQWYIFVQRRGGRFHRFFGIDDHGQRFVYDFDLLEGLLDDGVALSRYRRNGIAHVTDFAFREDVSVHSGTPVLDARRIRSGHHRMDTRQGLGFAGIDADNPGVGMLTPQYPSV